jgi:hypothetical protein
MSKFWVLCAAMTGLLAATPQAARAQTVDFSYSGSGNVFAPDIMASGTGSFTTNSLGDLLSFTFDLTLSSVTLGGTDTYVFNLADVTSFQASFTNNVLTGLMLMTDQQPGYYFPNEFFEVDDLGIDGASTGDFDVGMISQGTVTVDTPVPEPAGVVVFAAGLVGLGLARGRTRAVRACLG